MRVVFDSNIFVSALTLPGGQADRPLRRVIDGRDHLILSKAVIHETLGVLARKFSRDREELARVAVFLADIGSVVSPRRRVDVLDDEADNRILECAVVGDADLIVTGDNAMLRLGEYRGVRILASRDYLALT